MQQRAKMQPAAVWEGAVPPAPRRTWKSALPEFP
jgi:hypothetical protein